MIKFSGDQSHQKKLMATQLILMFNDKILERNHCDTPQTALLNIHSKNTWKIDSEGAPQALQELQTCNQSYEIFYSM